MIRIAAWERGIGQGYVLTPDGQIALATGRPLPNRSHESNPSENRPVFSTSLELPGQGPSPESPRLLIVPLLLSLNLLWFFVGLVVVLRGGHSLWPFLTEGNPGILHRLGAVNGLDLLQGEWWRLLTACFVHGGGAHLLLNLFGLIIVGPQAEIDWGRTRLMVIYLGAGLAGNSLAMALKPDSMLAGASGAIWGLLMSLIVWLTLNRHTLPPDIAAESIRRLIVVIVLNAMFSFVPGISWQAHLGGALGGLATAGLLNAMRFGKRRRRIGACTLFLVLTLGSIGGLLAAMRWSESWAGYRHRVADNDKRLAIVAVQEQFNRDVLPLLDQLKPIVVVDPKRGIQFELEPAEISAINQLNRLGPRRNAARVAEARTKLTQLKRIADAVGGHLQGPPVGVESIDGTRARTREFAEMRSRSIELLLAMLDSPAIPDEAAWNAWLNACRTADTLWMQIAKR